MGAQVRLRRVGPVDGTRAPGHTPVPAPATPQDISWADTVVFGAAVRLGAMAAPLLDFIQSLEPSDPTARGPLWGKPAGGFVTVPRPHAGSESAPLALNHLLLHSGAVVVTPGFTDPSVVEAGGTPYGVCHPLTEGAVPTPAALAAAAHQGRRTALAGDLLRRGAGRGAGKGEPHERAAV